MTYFKALNAILGSQTYASEVFVRILRHFPNSPKFNSALDNLQKFKLGKASYVWILHKNMLRFCPRDSFYLQKCVQFPKMCVIKGTLMQI